jgi:hypothetical protein
MRIRVGRCRYWEIRQVMEAARSVAEFEKEGRCGLAVDLRWFRGRRHAGELVFGW